MMDIILTFITAYKKDDGSSETRKKAIAINYFKGWFVIDVVSTFPYQTL